MLLGGLQPPTDTLVDLAILPTYQWGVDTPGMMAVLSAIISGEGAVLSAPPSLLCNHKHAAHHFMWPKR